MSDLKEMPCASFLEEALQEIQKREPEKIMIAMRMPDGQVMLGSWNCNTEDKAIMAHHIYMESVYEEIKANADEIVLKGQQLLEDEDDESE